MGGLGPQVQAAWSIPSSSFALYHHEEHMERVEYQIWVAYGTASPSRDRRLRRRARSFTSTPSRASSTRAEIGTPFMSTLSSSLFRRLWDGFLLQSLERDVATYDAAQVRLVRSLYEGGAARAAVAREMLTRGNLLACVDLSRAAAALFAEAILVARAPHQASSGLRAPELWHRVQNLMERGEVPPSHRASHAPERRCSMRGRARPWVRQGPNRSS